MSPTKLQPNFRNARQEKRSTSLPASAVCITPFHRPAGANREVSFKTGRFLSRAVGAPRLRNTLDIPAYSPVSEAALFLQLPNHELHQNPWILSAGGAPWVM